MTDTPRTTLTDGSPVTDDHREKITAGPLKGQQKGYVVLSADERAKGFVRPVRNKYVHVGAPKPVNLRELTAEERTWGEKDGYVGFEPNTDGDSEVLGKFWTQKELDRVNAGGCGALTTMGQALAETYAREPEFYSGTFCCGCQEHFAVGQKGEFVWDGTEERVGT